MMIHNCGYDDCFSCPYLDCIATDTLIEPHNRQKCGRKPLKEGERAERDRIAARKYYAEHREEQNAKNKARYHRKKAEREAKERGEA